MSFEHGKGGHCGSSALRDLLAHRGLDYGRGPLSEAMAFGLAGALAFAFADDVVPFEGSGAALPLYLNGRSETLETDLCAHLGLGVELRRTDDAEEGWAWLRDELDAGVPTLVWANLRDLDYQCVKLDNTRHALVVVGYDGGARVATVADHDFAALQRVSLDSLARARAARAFPGPVRHATAIVRYPERLVDAELAVEAGIRRALATMRHAEPVSWEIALPGRPPQTVPYLQGLRGLDALIDSYAGWPERFGDELRTTLKLLYILLERAGTGGAFYRAFQARFLAESAQLLGDASLRAGADHYARLAAQWRTVADALRSSDPQRAHDVAGSELVRALELERRGVELLERWLACREPERVAA